MKDITNKLNEQGRIVKHPNVAHIHSYCQIDLKKTTWKYIGEQPTGKPDQSLHLFNCLECGTTRTMGALMSYNLDVQNSRRVEPW